MEELNCECIRKIVNRNEKRSASRRATEDEADTKEVGVQ